MTGLPTWVDSLLAIHQQREDTAGIAECLAGLLCKLDCSHNQRWVGQ